MGYILLMILSATGMVIGLKKSKKGDVMGKPLTAISILFSLVFALMHTCNSAGTKTKDIIRNEMMYQQASTTILGKYLAENFPDSKVLVITDIPRDNLGKKSIKTRTDYLMDGLKEGFSEADLEITAVDWPKIPESAKMEMPDGMYEMQPMEFWFNSKIFNDIVDAHKDCDLIVSFVGLPPDPTELANIKLWSIKDPKKRPKLALVNAPVFDLGMVIKRGFVKAAVVYNPNAKYTTEPPPEELQARFDKRYILVTDKNIKEVSGKCPGMFKELNFDDAEDSEK